jgi:hypothetical protein
MSRCGVVVNAGPSAGIDVDGGVIEAGHAVDQLVMGLGGDCVGLDNTERVVDVASVMQGPTIDRG